MDTFEVIKKGDIYQVRFLLADGWDPTIDDNEAIRMASSYGHVDIVSLLLKDKRVNPAAFKNHAIQKACHNGHIKIVKLLLQDSRVDPSDDNNLAIQWASGWGYADIVEILLKDGRADPTYALTMACMGGHIEVVKVLLQDGRVEPSDYVIKNAKTDEIKELLIGYKYRVDGEEYQKLKNEINF